MVLLRLTRKVNYASFDCPALDLSKQGYLGIIVKGFQASSFGPEATVLLLNFRFVDTDKSTDIIDRWGHIVGSILEIFLLQQHYLSNSLRFGPLSGFFTFMRFLCQKRRCTLLQALSNCLVLRGQVQEELCT